MKYRFLSAVIAVSALAAVFSCRMRHQAPPGPLSSLRLGVAVLSPTANHVARGIVQFEQLGSAVHVIADVEGLTPGQKHAMHIHQYGDLSSADGMAAGGHYNPDGHPHGLPGAPKHHAGDLGNLEADASGKAHLEITLENLGFASGKNPIIGRSVIVHAKMDDGGQPVGNAGGRIAQGVIGVAKQGK